MKLSWEAPVDDGGALDGYQYRHSAGSTVTTTATWSATVTAKEATVTGLTNGMGLRLRGAGGEQRGRTVLGPNALSVRACASASPAAARRDRRGPHPNTDTDKPQIPAPEGANANPCALKMNQ